MGRLERKLALLLMAVVASALAAALGTGWLALREAYSVGVNERIDAELKSALAAHRERIRLLRILAERSADLFALDPELRRAARSHDVPSAEARLRALVLAHEPVDSAMLLGRGWRASAKGGPREIDGPSLELERSMHDRDGSPLATLRITARLPRRLLDTYQRAGELQHDYEVLLEGRRTLTRAYLIVYLGVLGAASTLLLALSLAAARRVVRRIRLLAEAAHRVGGGDLSVHLTPRGSDEVAELTEAFNTMVRDLRESRQRLEYLQRVGAWQQFARRLAHEIKNPLTPIRLAAQQLRHVWETEGPERLEPTLKEACRIIEEEVDTLHLLVDEFSAFAKLPRIRLEPGDLRELLEELPRSISAAAHDAALDVERIRVSLSLPDRPLPARFDAVMLRRAMDNLLRNAVEALAPEGGGEIRIEARKTPDALVVEVSDDGPGIAEEHAERIFEPYFTSKAHGGGTGLGLAIVKKVILEHGGEISLIQSEGRGARFRIVLPDPPQGRDASEPEESTS